MQAGDIVFVRGHTPMSRLIRLFDHGEFSHVAIAVSKTHVLEAQYGTRVRIVPFRFNLEDCEIVDLGLTTQQRWKIKDDCLWFVGKQYDYLQAISYAFKGFRYDNPNHHICTEIIHEMLRNVEYNCCPSDLKPNELYKFLTRKGA